MRQALKLIEQGDRLMGHGRFLSAFIDDWAFALTGAYPPEKPLTQEQQQIASELSGEIRKLMEENPGHDILGTLFCENGHSGHLSFYPTPSPVASIMSTICQLSGGKQIGLCDFLDLAAGTGQITLSHIKNVHESEGRAGVAKLKLHAEELDPIKVKSLVIQVINLLDILGDRTPLYVNSFWAITINSLTRETGEVQYRFSGINNSECKLNDEQIRLINLGLREGFSPEVISTKLRVPYSLVLKEQQQQRLIA